VRLIGLKGGDAVAGILVLSEDRDIMLISTDGVLIRTPSSEVAQQGRGAHGVRVMRLGTTDRVSAIAAVPEDDGDAEGDGGEG
jgi:DNA gyrase subunit A